MPFEIRDQRHNHNVANGFLTEASFLRYLKKNKYLWDCEGYDVVFTDAAEVARHPLDFIAVDLEKKVAEADKARKIEVAESKLYSLLDELSERDKKMYEKLVKEVDPYTNRVLKSFSHKVDDHWYHIQAGPHSGSYLANGSRNALKFNSLIEVGKYIKKLKHDLTHYTLVEFANKEVWRRPLSSYLEKVSGRTVGAIIDEIKKISKDLEEMA